MPFLIGETQRLLSFEDIKISSIFKSKSARITFAITSDSTHKRIRMREPDFHISSEAISIMNKPIQVNEQEFLACKDNQQAYLKISDLFSSLDINPSDKEIIGYNLIKQARMLSRRSSWFGCDKLINVEMILTTIYWWQGTIPASFASVLDLKKGKIEEVAEENCEKSCSICLEMFEGISDVKSTPCLHIFHWKCIDEWLSKSHYCPLCRFEMPISCFDFH